MFVHQFSTEYFIVDTDGDQELGDSEPIFHDSNGDYQLSNADSFVKSGVVNVKTLNKSTLNISYFNPHQDDNVNYELGEPIVYLNSNGQFDVGSLDSGNSTVALSGEAPILGFSETNDTERVFDVIPNSANVNFDRQEAIILSNQTLLLSSGKLNSGDDIVAKSGVANLTTFQRNGTFFLNVINSSKPHYDGEALIRDSNIGDIGNLDESDTIVGSGPASVDEIRSNVSTFGTGDVYIQESDSDSNLDPGEFLFVESGQSPGYQPGDDLVLTIRNNSNPDEANSSVHQIGASDISNLIFLDTNQNGFLDTAPESNNLPGTEPILLTNARDVSPSENISIDDSILGSAGSNSSFLDTNGNLLEGTIYRDMNNSTGTFNNGSLEFSDSSNGQFGRFDTGELIIENGGIHGELESDDYVIRDVMVPDTHLELITQREQFLDTNHNKKYDDSDPILLSSDDSDVIIERTDSIVYPGNISISNQFSNKIEYIDEDRNSKLSQFEPVIRSQTPGDSIISINDTILRTQSNQGQLNTAVLDQTFPNEDGGVEIFLSNNSSTTSYNSGLPIAEVTEMRNTNSFSEIVGRNLSTFSNSIGGLDYDSNYSLDNSEPIFRENDAATVSNNSFGDRLTTLTVRNNGTLPDEGIDSIELLENGTVIGNVSTPTNGTWVFEIPAENGTVGPSGNGTEFTFHTILADTATGGKTVELLVPPVSDSGTAGVYDPGDTGAFFEQDSPIGDIGPGATLTVTASGGGGGSTPEPATIDISLSNTDLTTADETIPVQIQTDTPDRGLQVDLVNATTNITVTEAQLVPDPDGRGQVSFETRRGRFQVRVTEPESGSVAVSETFTISSPPAVAFTAPNYSVSRGETASIPITLRNAEEAEFRLTSPTGRSVDTVSLSNISGPEVSLRLDTSMVGHGPAGTGIEVTGSNGTLETISTVAAPPEDSSNGTAPPAAEARKAKPAPVALGAGRYTLSLAVEGNVTDRATLHVTTAWTGEIETFVAPAGVNLSDPEQVTLRSTRRAEIAAGDTLVMRVTTTGLGRSARNITVAKGRPDAVPGASSPAAFADIRNRRGPPRRGPSPASHLRELPTTDAGTFLFALPTSVNGTETVHPGTRYGAAFGLTEASPLVAGSQTPDSLEREPVGANVSVVEARANFSSLSANGTLDLPPAANATIAGTTTVAPHTVAVVHVTVTDGNETDSIESESTIHADGTYKTTVDMSDYDPGTNYTVSVTANDEQLSPLRTGSIEGVESTSFGAAGGGGGGFSAQGSGDDAPSTSTPPTETTSRATTPLTEEADGGLQPPNLDELRERAWQVLPEPLRVGSGTLLVAALGLLAMLMVLLGVRRLL